MIPVESQPPILQSPDSSRAPTPEPVPKPQPATIGTGHEVTSVPPSQEASVLTVATAQMLGKTLKTSAARIQAEATLRLQEVSNAYALGNKAEKASKQLLAFKRKCGDSQEKEIRFCQPGGLSSKLLNVYQRCLALVQSDNPDSPLAQGIADLKCKPDFIETYYNAMAKALAFLGNYDCVFAESSATTLFGAARRSISCHFSSKVETRQQLGHIFNRVATRFLTGLYHFTKCQKLQIKNGTIEKESEESLQAKIDSLMPVFYKKVAFLYTGCHETMVQAQDNDPSPRKTFPAEPAVETLRLLQIIFNGFRDDSAQGVLLESDRSFKVTEDDKRKPEEAINLYCFRILMGAISSHFELTKTSMQDMAQFCTETTALKGGLPKYENELLDFPSAVLDVSLIVASQLVQQGDSVTEVQSMRLRAIHLLTDLQTCWSTFHPHPKETTPSEKRHNKLQTLLTQIQKDLDNTIKRATKALEIMEESKKEKPAPKSTTTYPAGTLINELCKSEALTPTEEQKKIAGATASPSLADIAIRNNWEALEEAAGKLKENKLTECFKAYQQVINSSAQNSTPDQQLLARYGMVEWNYVQAKEAYTSCLQSIPFINSYSEALRNPQLPPPQNGQQFPTMVELFKTHFQVFSLNIGLMERRRRDLEKMMLLKDSTFFDNQELQQSLQWIREECCQCIQKLDETAAELPDICERRKTRLKDLQPVSSPENKIPYSYKDALEGISKNKQSLAKLLPSLKQGFDVSCEGAKSPVAL